MDPHLYDVFYGIEDHYWWSVGTRRIFFDLIASLSLDERARVLDVGCGTGVTLRELPGRWRVAAGCDASAQGLAYCRQRGLRALVRADAGRLPFASGCMDLLLALDLIEHLDDDAGCLGEIARVCRPGGHVLVHVPAFPVLWNDKDVLNHHRRRYRRRELLRLLESCGLLAERVLYINFFIFPAALLAALSIRLLHRRRLEMPDPRSLDRLYAIPPALNRAMTALLDLERRLNRQVRLPFGVSLLCLARKAGPDRPLPCEAGEG
jgi:SAM-dependent methyltransferase